SADITDEEKSSYPNRPVLPGGRADQLLQQYDNLYADLSANSGYYAITRDPQFAKGFFTRNQDKLLYGSDIVSKGQVLKNHLGIEEIDVDDTIKHKIFYSNSKKLFNL
ncbi:MAG: amidohydrolase, partial [Candidatus Heimdallarchaeota archaeon]|nr:amidohydrolase [Candidatus Heimdallarchaeota archaeon]